MLTKNLALTICLVFFAGSILTAQNFEYVGAAKCKMCHNKPATGEQYKIWSAGPHANAMKSLSNEKSLAYAKKNGIADPTKEASCLKCHATFNAVSKTLHAGITQAEGVSCESCHGPGSAYYPTTIMKDQKKAIEKGLVVPDKKLCETCHNAKNPFHKPFNYEAAKAKIAHKNPAAP